MRVSIKHTNRVSKWIYLSKYYFLLKGKEQKFKKEKEVYKEQREGKIFPLIFQHSFLYINRNYRLTV